jgi:hypothetical protein
MILICGEKDKEDLLNIKLGAEFLNRVESNKGAKKCTNT